MNAFGASISRGIFGLAGFSRFLTTQTTQPIALGSLQFSKTWTTRPISLVLTLDSSLAAILISVYATATVATVNSWDCTEFCALTPKNKNRTKARGGGYLCANQFLMGKV